MALTLNGSTGITSANIQDGSITNSDVNDVAASKLTGALPAIDGSKLTGTGKVLQVVNTNHNNRLNTTSTSWVSTDTTATITPTSNTSKIFISVTSNCDVNNTQGVIAFYTIFRDSTDLNTGSYGFGNIYGGSARTRVPIGLSYMDSPSTTSSVTYTFKVKSGASGTSVEFSGQNDMTHSITLMEIEG